MKKLFALVLVLAMVLSAAAMADETAEATVDVVDWNGVISNEGMDAFVANGDFYSLDALGLKMWIPNGLNPVESESSAYLFMDEEGTSGLTVFVEEAPEGLDPMDPDALFAYVHNDVGGVETTPSVVNGIYCVSYKLGDEDLMQYCMTYGSADGHLIHFVADGVDAENLEDMTALLLMMSSIQAI